MNLIQIILHLCCEYTPILLNTVDLSCYKINLTIALSGTLNSDRYGDKIWQPQAARG